MSMRTAGVMLVRSAGKAPPAPAVTDSVSHCFQYQVGRAPDEDGVAPAGRFAIRALAFGTRCFADSC